MYFFDHLFETTVFSNMIVVHQTFLAHMIDQLGCFKRTGQHKRSYGIVMDIFSKAGLRRHHRGDGKFRKEDVPWPQAWLLFGKTDEV